MSKQKQSCAQGSWLGNLQPHAAAHDSSHAPLACYCWLRFREILHMDQFGPSYRLTTYMFVGKWAGRHTERIGFLFARCAGPNITELYPSEMRQWQNHLQKHQKQISIGLARNSTRNRRRKGKIKPSRRRTMKESNASSVLLRKENRVRTGQTVGAGAPGWSLHWIVPFFYCLIRV